MDTLKQDELFFFEQHREAYSLYEALEEELIRRFPETRIRVQKTQITFSNRHVYACVSFMRVKKKAELPEPYLVLTLGLSYPLPYRLDSPRVVAASEPYPGRWTTHFVLSSQSELDEELFGWVREAWDFAAEK